MRAVHGSSSAVPVSGSLNSSKPITAGCSAQRRATTSSIAAKSACRPAGSAGSKKVLNAMRVCAESRRSPRSVSGPPRSIVGGGWIAQSGAPSSPISFEYASWCRSITTYTPASAAHVTAASTRARYASSYWPRAGSMPLQLIGKRRRSKPSWRMRTQSAAVSGGIGSSGARPSANVTSNTPSTRALIPRSTATRPSASRRCVPSDHSGVVRGAASSSLHPASAISAASQALMGGESIRSGRRAHPSHRRRTPPPRARS